MSDMYESILRLPIFLGLNSITLTSLLEKSAVQFLKFTNDELIVNKGDECTHLKFVVSGKIRIENEVVHGKVMICEEFDAPNIIAPDYLFGKDTSYPYAVTSVGETSIMQISKTTFINVMMSHEICLINMLNLTSNKSQNTMNNFSFMSASDMKEKLSRWILNLTSKQGQNINIKCRHKDLYTFFGMQRSVFINVLNELKESEIIDYDASSIKLLDRYALKDICSKDISMYIENNW